MSDEKILRQIAAALRTAENAGTEAEADNALQVAQRLATTYSIDLAVARSRSAPERRSAPTHRTITLGEPRKRGLRTFVELFLTIAAANDVTCNIAHNSTYVIAFGYEDDIALCEALYASLVVQMVRASDGYLKRGTHRTETVEREVYVRGSWKVERVPISGTMARINFHKAFTVRVGERLVSARQQARDDAVRADRELMERTGIREPDAVPGSAAVGRTGTEIAIVEKAAEVDDYYKRASTARGTWRGSRAHTDVSADARRAGHRAGSTARLGTEPAIGGSRRAIRGQDAS